LWQSAMWWSWRDLTNLANTGDRWLDYSDLGSRYSLYRTADDRVALVAPSERRFWEPFVDLLELPPEWKAVGDWSASGMDHGAGEAYAHERPVIAQALARRTIDQWTELLGDAEIPFAPILTLEEAMESEHARVNGVLRSTTMPDGREYRLAALPVRLGEDAEHATAGPLSPPPELGADTEALLAELGLPPR
jgi:crotonobetainyl-CoA:carnitine CoA-transferase CaiB-like acyl-CoA transferase